jgi:hypothetical protein
MPESVPISTVPSGLGTDPWADAAFEARWAAWQARGRMHERAVKRRVLMAVPVLAIGVAIAYLLIR